MPEGTSTNGMSFVRALLYMPLLTHTFSGTKNGKRVQSNMGAKNHAILMPDGMCWMTHCQTANLYAYPANKNHALNSIIGAAFGGKLTSSLWTQYAHEIPLKAAGQRCMAISVALLIGDAQAWLPDLVNLAKNLRVGGGFEKGVDL